MSWNPRIVGGRAGSSRRRTVANRAGSGLRAKLPNFPERASVSLGKMDATPQREK